MSERRTAFSAAALEDVAYLSRSANRVAILDALTAGSFSRGELADRTGVSRTTLDRIVNELEERGWAERTTDGTYAATTRATHLMRRFRPFLASVEAIHELDEAIAWLPVEEFSIGLEHFSDAVVRRPRADDPAEAVAFMTDLLEGASEFRALSHLVPPQQLAETMHESVTARRLRMDAVITDELVAYLGTRPERTERWRTLIDAGADIRRVDGPIPCNLWIFDETVLIKQSGPGPVDESYGVPIVSENPAVRSWAHDLIDRWMETGSRIDADAFDDPPVASERSVD